ncbi:MAG: hypothetical protein ACTSRA_04080, partial [Promethearchaeota archaeon]
MGRVDFSGAQKHRYLAILKEGSSPFDRFVSRGDMADLVDISRPRADVDAAVDRSVVKIFHDGRSRFLPVLGVAGSGKTHAYWGLKDKLQSWDDINCIMVYVPSPPSAVRIYFHVYTCIASEVPDIPSLLLENLLLQNPWITARKKALKRKGIERILGTLLEHYPSSFADTLRALLTCHFHENEVKRGLAKRWLLGDVLFEKELEKIRIDSVMESDTNCLSVLKLLTFSHGLGSDDRANLRRRRMLLILYFDEFESPLRTHGTEAAKKFIDTLEEILNSINNTLVIGAVLKDIWHQLKLMFSNEFQALVDEPVTILPFTLDDTRELFINSQDRFWHENGLDPPPDPLFPLNEA